MQPDANLDVNMIILLLISVLFVCWMFLPVVSLNVSVLF